MKQNTASFKIRGMIRDVNQSDISQVSKDNPTHQYAYENMNMRINAVDNNTQYALSNERGTLEINNITGIPSGIQGIPIGQNILNDTVTLFTTDTDLEIPDINPGITYPLIIPELYDIRIDIFNRTDRIYKLWFENMELHGKLLYAGNLNFNISNPIDTISYYENDELQKVYWIDGLNQPRVINIEAANDVMQNWNDRSFDFVRTMKLKEKVTIVKNKIVEGYFNAGTIQYCFTYFDRYMQETNIFYKSPIFYTSYVDRGTPVNETVSNSFNIKIDDVDMDFEYLRIYSIMRTAENTIPQCSIVADIPISDIPLVSRHSVTYIDNGIHKQTIDPTELLYVGGEEITANTFEHKDNTLFLGDIELKKHIAGDIESPSTGESIKSKLYNKSNSITFNANKKIPAWALEGVYSHTNQLNYNSSEIKTFKSGEWYRFGIQFQYKTGIWSEPLWICDKRNDKHITGAYVRDVTHESTFLITAHSIMYDLLDDSDIAILKSNGFVKVRPVVVYPKFEEREVLCQGYLCPTVFNYADRYYKHCHAQSSWFARPNYTLSRYNVSRDYIQNDNEVPYSNNHWEDIHEFKKGYSGRPLEYRHNFPIPKNKSFSAEIQNIKIAKNPQLNDEFHPGSLIDVSDFINEYGHCYAVDSNIVTMHSPDIEDLNNLDLSKCKMRIIGMIPLTSSAGKATIITDTAGHLSYDGHWNVSSLTLAPSKKNEVNPILENATINGANILGAGVLYEGMFYADNAGNDQIDNIGIYNPGTFSVIPDDQQENGELGQSTWRILQYPNGFVTYPWHRTGSLTNQCSGTPIYAKLKEKKLSNLRYSYNSFYFDNVWTPAEGLNDCQICDGNEPMPIKIKTIVDNKETYVLYKGSVDDVLYNGIDVDYPITVVKGLKMSGVNDVEPVDLYSSDFVTMSDVINDNHPNHRLRNKYMMKHRYSNSPVSMKYKSTSHIVCSLKNNVIGGNTYQNILPMLDFPVLTSYDVTHQLEYNEGFYGYTPQMSDSDQNYNYFWDRNIKRVHQDIITPLNTNLTGIGGNMGRRLYGFLWLAEIYRDDIENRFGGQTEEAFELNKWLPCGDAVDLDIDSEIIWSEGDTYYQRYDNLKTYPFTENDENSIIDIISFMCETRINIDGRTDRNRGNIDNTIARPTNFNLINKAYTQDDNFFTYNYINSNRINLDNFHNAITWTKTKIAGNLIDTWTNVTMVSTLNLDGDRGNVVSIKKLGNNIYALQNKAVCVIKFNENVVINTANGTPIELANSGKVLGKEYLSTEIGCDNKWSVCRSDNKLFFIDGNHSDIYALAGNQFVNLTAQFGFSSFMDSELENSRNWNPVSFNNFITYYDKINHDVFFINKDRCLAFNEVLNSFTSFYNYNNTPYFVNIGNRGMFINKAYNDTEYKPWMYEEGNYNQFFGEYKPYYTRIVVNDYPQTNKIFDVLEYRADAFNNLHQYDDLFTFDYIKTDNEYQNNDVDLTYSRHHSSNLKKKFRTWRATLPRDYSHRRDRMQNLWLNIEIGRRNFEELSKKHILYDMNVYYYM